VIPPPVVEEIQPGVFVVRDDLIQGGTKRCYVDAMIRGCREVVYASPAYGGAQIAIACAAKAQGASATIFVAKRKAPHARTMEAKANGAKVVQVSTGYLSNVQAKARAYAESVGATLLPFGLETPAATQAIANRARVVASAVGMLDEVWCVAGSGVIARGLQAGFEARRFVCVQVGRELRPRDRGCASVVVCPQPFEADAKSPPPFPSCSNYDAKGWQPFIFDGIGKRLFWNVAS
jgi:hypothetical protein